MASLDRRAIVDVGSNSVLLVVGERRGQTWVILKETSEVTALGEGLRQARRLSEEGMARTLDALRRAFALARSLGAETRAYGTMALRIAENAGEFLARAESQGTPLSVLSGEKEGELGLMAVIEDPVLASQRRIVVVDVGGHSTEIASATREDQWNIDFVQSFPLGTLGLRDLIAPAESVEGEDLRRVVTFVEGRLEELPPIGSGSSVVALGATATNLITLRDRITKWDPGEVHGKILTYEELSVLTHRLLPLTDAERASLPGLESGREHTIHLGALILLHVLRVLSVNACTVSTHGWRHALLARSD